MIIDINAVIATSLVAENETIVGDVVGDMLLLNFDFFFKLLLALCVEDADDEV